MFTRKLRSIFVVPSFARLNRCPEGDEGTGGEGGEGSGKGGTGGGEGGEAKGGKAKGGDKDELQHVLADLHKAKKEAKALREEKEALETARLKEKEDWKTLAEQNEKKAKEADENAQRIQTSFVNEKKYSAVKAKAMSLGLRAEAVDDLDMLDLDGVTVETTSTGKINIHGAEKFAEKLKTLKPHWFAPKTAPNVNTGGGRVIEGGEGEVTVRQVLDAEKEAKKTGDNTKYLELHKRFQNQRAKKA